MPSMLVDAGPLIALLDRSDRRHRWARDRLKRHQGALLTTWPVLAEVRHFLPEKIKVELLRWATGGAHLGDHFLGRTHLGAALFDQGRGA